MRVYNLVCPACGEEKSLFSYLHEPGKLTCSSCDDEFDVEHIKKIVDGFREWLEDYEAMVEDMAEDIYHEPPDKPERDWVAREKE